MEWLASELGCSRQNLTKTLANNPTIGTLERIAKALGVDVVDLFTPEAGAKIACPWCGKSITIKAEADEIAG